MSLSNGIRIDSLNNNYSYNAQMPVQYQPCISKDSLLQFAELQDFRLQDAPVEDLQPKKNNFWRNAGIVTGVAVAFDMFAFRGKHLKELLKTGKKPISMVQPQMLGGTKFAKVVMTKDAFEHIANVKKVFHTKPKINAKVIDELLKVKSNVGSWSSNDLRSYYSHLENSYKPTYQEVFGQRCNLNRLNLS